MAIMSRAQVDWRQTPHGEWIADGVGIIVGAQDHLWYGYPEQTNVRLGPFPDRKSAERALGKTLLVSRPSRVLA
jgi:hypothetical protein